MSPFGSKINFERTCIVDRKCLTYKGLQSNLEVETSMASVLQRTFVSSLTSKQLTALVFRTFQAIGA
ncbi:hypothetical protein Q31a_01370 [Aureliella helgolandensis]|uniref:Uncharacterized protein n=1 Tax=Aureliella helgolandensis TaxID=2527968 RepID=A0A518FZR7_9BACT|nr:hypothetical protein Q31a_01370 [Aureliella helgolandensis]